MGRSAILSPECKRRFALRAALNQGSSSRAISPGTAVDRQLGFTLVELVLVVVLIGVLSAVAIPKFLDMGDRADRAALETVAGSLSASSASNYAQRSLNHSKGVAIANCTDVGQTLPGGLPAGFQIIAAPVAADAEVNCTLTKASLTARFVALGVA